VLKKKQLKNMKLKLNLSHLQNLNLLLKKKSNKLLKDLLMLFRKRNKK
jgi:hypothetical protein